MAVGSAVPLLTKCNKCTLVAPHMSMLTHIKKSHDGDVDGYTAIIDSGEHGRHRHRMAMLSDLRRISTLTGKVRPSARDIQLHGRYTKRSYRHRFKSLNHARAAAGLHRPTIVETIRGLMTKLDGQRQTYVNSKRIEGYTTSCTSQVGSKLSTIHDDEALQNRLGISLNKWSGDQSPVLYRLRLEEPNKHTTIRGWSVTSPNIP